MLNPLGNPMDSLPHNFILNLKFSWALRKIAHFGRQSEVKASSCDASRRAASIDIGIFRGAQFYFQHQFIF